MNSRTCRHVFSNQPAYCVCACVRMRVVCWVRVGWGGWRSRGSSLCRLCAWWLLGSYRLNEQVSCNVQQKTGCTGTTNKQKPRKRYIRCNRACSHGNDVCWLLCVNTLGLHRRIGRSFGQQGCLAAVTRSWPLTCYPKGSTSRTYRTRMHSVVLLLQLQEQVTTDVVVACPCQYRWQKSRPNSLHKGISVVY